VNSSGILAFFFVLIFFGLMIGAVVFMRQREGLSLRQIPAFVRLNRAIGLAVEAGSRLHISLGRGKILSTQSAVGYVGLSILERIARSTSISDRPPIATSGEGTLGVLSQDTQREAAKYLGVEYDPIRGRITGLSPYSYAAGTLLTIQEEDMGANMLIGSFGSEVGLIAQEPLIGEETFAGGAYLGAGPMHKASLYAQDILRWVLIALIILGSILKLLGVV
jgi:hypothetical protein